MNKKHVVRKVFGQFRFVVYLLLILSMLAMPVAPAFAQAPANGNTPDGTSSQNASLNQFIAHSGVAPLSLEDQAKANRLAEHLYLNQSGQLVLNATASELGVSESEFTIVEQFIADVNSGETKIGLWTAQDTPEGSDSSPSGAQPGQGPRVDQQARIGTVAFQDLRHSIQAMRRSSPDARYWYGRWGIYIEFGPRETWWIRKGAKYIFTGILLWTAAVITGAAAKVAVGFVLKKVDSLFNYFGPRTFDYFHSWGRRWSWIRLHGTQSRWVNDRWLFLPHPMF